MPAEAARLLVVEDDPAMAIALRDGFRFEGYAVDVVGDGVAALRAVAEGRPDLIVLDLMLPRASGFEVCRELRRSGSDVPILMLTARGQESDKVQGLKLGADDYVTKPFGFLELLARVEALLRRAQRAAAPEHYAFGDVEVDLRQRTATRAGVPLGLSSREFSLLEYLIVHRGETVTREQLLQAVWGYDSLTLTRTVDVHVAKLRRKLEVDPSSPVWLLTVHRVGYRFVGQA
jgi:DNA-binding response OmpR family regulator